MQLLRKVSLGLFLTMIILLAIIMGGLRLAISNIDYFKPEIGYLLTRDVSKGIVFSGVSGSMNRFNPVLQIENVSITLPDRSQPLFIDRLAVEFDFWASLREQAPVVLEIAGKLEKLELTKDKSGRWWSHELEIATGTGTVSMPAFARVLSLAPRYLKLDLRRLIIRDQNNDVTHQLDRVSAGLNRKGDQFHTQISVALPGQLGNGIQVKSVLGPDRSVVYVNASYLQLPTIAALFDVDTLGLKDAAFDGEFWINMSGYHVIAINGDMVLKNGVLQVAADKTPLKIDYRSRFNAINLPSSWRITSDTQRLSINGDNVLGFRSQVEVAKGGEGSAISAWIERLQVSSLPVIAGQWLPPGISEQIAQGEIQGLIRNVMVNLDLEKPEQIKVSSQLLGLNSKAFASYPGAKNLNADLLIGRHKLALKVYGSEIRLDFGDRFRAPLELDELVLNAQADRLDSGAMLVSIDGLEIRNQDLKLQGRMWMQVDQSERPFVFLRASFSEANAGNAGKYLPVKLLPAGTLEWLDRGIIAGHAPTGDLQFHGRLRDVRVLDREKSGEFFVDFALEQGDVDFAPGWLHARKGNGRLLFHNAGLEFDLEQVSYEKIDNVRAIGRIADFDKPVLELAIKTKAPTAAAVRVWIDSPVGERYREAVSNLHDFDGQVAADIQISLPLSKDGRETQVRVNLDFDDAAVQAQNWGLELSDINGRFKVTGETMLARQLSARFFGDPIKVDVDSKPGDGVIVKAGGVLESGNLLRRLPIDSNNYLDGKSDWQVGIKISSDSVPDDQPYLLIDATSNLKNTKIILPRPFAKTVEESTRITAKLDFLPGEIRFKGQLGRDINARGRMIESDGKDFVLESFELAFAEPLQTERQPGLHLHGFIPDTSIAPWYDIYRRADDKNSSLYIGVDLEIDRVDAYGRDLESVDFDLKTVNQRLQGSVYSSLVEGSFEIPLQVSAQDPVIIDLGYMRLDELEQDSDYNLLLPGDVLPFRLNSQALVFHEMLFNDLVVTGNPEGDTLVIDNMSMRRDNVDVSGKGQWEYDATKDSHLSSVSVTVKGPNVGQALAGIGFGDNIQDGDIELEGTFSWPVPMPAFTLGNFEADVKMQIKDGVLNNVEPGGGRFVGLLSLNALPRRLSLDFSDVLIKGMEFEKISGTYRVEKGIIYTEDTRMEGPAAKIKIKGTTGIVERNYDQTIRVTPKIRQTLPLVGAVAIGSTVGWGLLLLQNLFKKSIDDAVEVVYQVTGSWDDPQIELIKAVDENQQELPKIEIEK